MGQSYSTKGAVDRQKRLSIWIHFGINILGTILLSASYCDMKGRTVCIGYGAMTRYRSKGPRCVGKGRVV